MLIAPVVAADPLAGLDPGDPHPVYADLRAAAALHWSPFFGAWAVLRYAEAAAILRHPDFTMDDPAERIARVTRRGGPKLANLSGIFGCIASLNDPARSRGVKRVFAHLLATWDDRELPLLLARRADALLDAAEASGALDLAQGFGRPLAVFAFGSLLGLPDDEHAALLSPMGAIGCVGREMHALRELNRMEAEAAGLTRYFRAAIARSRAGGMRDGLGRLLRLADQELGWNEDALAGLLAFLLGAARETTAAAIAGCGAELLRRPALRALLRAEPEMLPAVARELLRLVAPFRYVSRIATRDVVIGGQAIHAGQAACLFLGAANRDPAAFPDPDEAVPGRAGPEPLTFAAGPFRCLGAHLATLELHIALARLLARDRLRLAADPPVWGQRRHVLQLHALPAVFAAG